MLHRKDKIFQNLISTKINNTTKYNLIGKQDHLPFLLNSAFREVDSDESNCQNENLNK